MTNAGGDGKTSSTGDEKAGSCQLCAGLLSSDNLEHTASLIISGLDRYETTDYSLFIGLPISVEQILPTVFIKAYSQPSAASEQNGDGGNGMAKTEVVIKEEVKKVYRQLVSDLVLSKGRDKKYTCVTDSQVQVTIQVVDKGTDVNTLKKLLFHNSKSIDANSGSGGAGYKKNKNIKVSKESFRKLSTLHESNDNGSTGKGESGDIELLQSIARNVELDIQLERVRRTSYYLGGRYNKYSRKISQTPMFKGMQSVSDVILTAGSYQDGEDGFREVFGLGNSDKGVQEGGIDDFVTQTKFVGSGREDVDVLMLGSGRPFYFELLDCTRRLDNITPQSIKLLEEKINRNATGKLLGEDGESGDKAIVKVDKLQLIGEQQTRIIKHEQEEYAKRKEYSCLLWIGENNNHKKPHLNTQEKFTENGDNTNTNNNNNNNYELNRFIGEYMKLDGDKIQLVLDKPFTINQKTPVRVLHRRANTTRARTIHTMTLKRHPQTENSSSHLYILHLTTDSGTYIKEFVHGDLGRTVPSLADILTRKTEIVTENNNNSSSDSELFIDLLELNVQHVDLPFP
ncbi:putative tRNA pseudouridine synthase Pus10 [Zancudomyces culisetae]|uniref:tRNA pseudouridine(55) synthase n=1 Tax=Zancudomyces culisetae TaxID=1213189 RepID=A0A1R1PHV2_ZANCU|nr:putative tRNA pseudouridine synthase Pus10 [Zancudomyces culisetae]|eukprot:OMH80536.1 putative tRNA pseudouridine synthase Pus10 [Zancudomyces culisetae]